MADQLTTILLIRHAKSLPAADVQESDWPLSQPGHHQASLLAVELADSGIDKIVSSPYIRAIDTVRPLADQTGCSIETDNGLREKKVCEGMRDDWNELIKKSWGDFSFAVPEGESNVTCQKRITRSILNIINKNPGKTIAVCSHGNAIGLFLNFLDPDFGYLHWKKMNMPDVFKIEYQNGTFKRHCFSIESLQIHHD